MGQQVEAVAVQHQLDFHVLGADRVDVVDNLLLAVALVGTGIAGSRQRQSECDDNRREKSGEKSHEFLPNVTVMREVEQQRRASQCRTLRDRT